MKKAALLMFILSLIVIFSACHDFSSYAEEAYPDEDEMMSEYEDDYSEDEDHDESEDEESEEKTTKKKETTSSEEKTTKKTEKPSAEEKTTKKTENTTADNKPSNADKNNTTDIPKRSNAELLEILKSTLWNVNRYETYVIEFCDNGVAKELNWMWDETEGKIVTGEYCDPAIIYKYEIEDGNVYIYTAGKRIKLDYICKNSGLDLSNSTLESYGTLGRLEDDEYFFLETGFDHANAENDIVHEVSMVPFEVMNRR